MTEDELTELKILLTRRRVTQREVERVTGWNGTVLSLRLNGHRKAPAGFEQEFRAAVEQICRNRDELRPAAAQADREPVGVAGR